MRILSLIIKKNHRPKISNNFYFNLCNIRRPIYSITHTSKLTDGPLVGDFPHKQPQLYEHFHIGEKVLPFPTFLPTKTWF